MADNVLDLTFITSQLALFYTSVGLTPGPRGSGALDIAYYAGEIKKTGGWTDDVPGTHEHNIGYWEGRIQSDLKKSQGGGGSSGGGSDTTVANPSALIAPQLGLLEDDIIYRLSMLAVNVLQPLKNKYPNIVITSGFRQTNSGIGQHELAEAVDLQIQNQTPELLYEVADFIQKQLPFDQLILNFTMVGTGEPWIHVSFSATSNRGLVLTKDFADTFHQGLFLVEPLTGEAAAQAKRDIQTQQAGILKELTNIQSRQSRLSTTTKNIDDVADSGGGSGGSSGGGGLGPTQLPQVDGVIYPLGDNWPADGAAAKLGATLLSGTFGQAAVDAVMAQFPDSGAIYYPNNNIYAVIGYYTSLVKRDIDPFGAWDLINH